MSKLIGVDLEFRGGAQCHFLRVHNRSTAPASPKAGQLWFDTTLKRLKLFDGLVWIDYFQLITSGPARRFQFFPPSSALSLTITEQPSTLPAENNLITLHANGVRLFPDQAAIQLDWDRDAINAPATISLHRRDGEWIMIEW